MRAFRMRTRGRNDPNPWLLGDLDPEDPRSPAHQIADRIREAIADGVLRPGDLVPGTPLIARRYGVSHGTTGRALKDLADEGLVRTYRGRGSYVAGGE